MKLRRPVLQQLHKAFSPTRPRPPSQVLAFAARSRATTQPRRTYASVSAADLQFGQPVYETHPHLLRPGESVSILMA